MPRVTEPRDDAPGEAREEGGNEAGNAIPAPRLQSWMHPRVRLPRESRAERRARYRRQDRLERVAAAITSRLLKWLGFGRPRRRWALYRLVTRALHAFYRARNRLVVRGWRHVPPGGALFVINHVAGQDVVVPFLAAFRRPLAVFTDMGNGWFNDVAERLLGWVTRRGTAAEMVEKMVRVLVTRHRYLAMWPEGTLERAGQVMQGFSGIVRVYATLNARRDVVPFVPVFMTEAGPGDPLAFQFLPPYFVPRAWLRPPAEGGKTPRQIIDAVMLRLARLKGQAALAPNPVLERRRQRATDRRWH